MSSRGARRRGSRHRVQVIVPGGPHKGELMQATATIGEHFLEWRVSSQAFAYPHGLSGTAGVGAEGTWWCRGWKTRDGRALQAANALVLSGVD